MTGRGAGASEVAAATGRGRGQGVGSNMPKCPTDATPMQKARCEEMRKGKKSATINVESRSPKGKMEVERKVPMNKARALAQSARRWR
jgi:hypothetical protein